MSTIPKFYHLPDGRRLCPCGVGEPFCMKCGECHHCPRLNNHQCTLCDELFGGRCVGGKDQEEHCE